MTVLRLATASLATSIYLITTAFIDIPDTTAERVFRTINVGIALPANLLLACSTITRLKETQ